MLNFPHLLDDTQEHALSETQRDLLRLDRFIKNINRKIIDYKLKLPTVRAPEVGNVFGETQRMVFNHELAKQQLRRAAGAPDRKSA